MHPVSPLLDRALEPARHRRAHRAFTLVELLIVIAVIMVLAGLTLSLVSTLRFKARALDTLHRMETVMNALASYGQSEGSAASAFQTALPLGGVVKFSSMLVISDIITAGGGGRALPPLLVKPTSSGIAWSTSGDESYQQQPMWKNVFDVLPASSGNVSASYYEDTWKYQWLESDWYKTPPGAVPPILRFPWGKPGLCLNGAICDPASPASTVIGKQIEYSDFVSWQNSTGGIAVPIINSWVTLGSSGGGAKLQFTTADGSQDAPVVSPVTAVRSDGTTVSVDANQPPPFDLGYLSPLMTIELLKIAEILPADGDSVYRADRKPSRQWNDAWGNPLVVAYALFQPERFQRIYDGQNHRHLLLNSATAAYQYNRSMYLSVGAIGPERGALAPRIADLATSGSSAADHADLAPIWQQVCDTCGAARWTEHAFASPPWKDVAKGVKNGMRSFLTAPIEVR